MQKFIELILDFIDQSSMVKPRALSLLNMILCISLVIELLSLYILHRFDLQGVITNIHEHYLKHLGLLMEFAKLKHLWKN